MRVVPPAMHAAWLSGDYEPMARITVQHGGMKLKHLPYNTYADFVFGARARPREMPNLKSVQWSRNVDQDTATATFVFYNTVPLPLGVAPTRDLDRPGYYTYNRGKGGKLSARWGTTVNEWSGLLMPDNILRSYEGFGFDPNVIPELDPHLVSSGVWRIDEVDYTHDGLITVTARDLASVLMDQICFTPVVPSNFYPLFFDAVPKVSGINQGYFYATQTSINKKAALPSWWHGPTTTASTVTVTPGDRQLTVHVTGHAEPSHPGYHRVGFYVEIDNVTDAKYHSYGPGHTGSVDVAYRRLQNGNAYQVSVRDVWEQTASGDRQTVNSSPTVMGAPHAAGVTTAVTDGSILTDDGPPPPGGGAVVPTPGSVAWRYTGPKPDRFAVVAFRPGGRKVLQQTPTGVGTQYVQTGLGTLAGSGWSFLVYPVVGGLAGAGAVYAATGAYLAPPLHDNNPPMVAAPQTGPHVTTKSGAVVPLKPERLSMRLSDSSNTYYEGGFKDAAVFGHRPDDAFDDDPSSYWLSIGNQRSDQGYSFEWIEGSLRNVQLQQVELSTVRSGYLAYVSVWANGAWVNIDGKIIPYDPHNPESHNGGNVPYLAAAVVTSEKPMRITLKTPIANATKVRVTFHNLQNFPVGTYHHRAAVRTLRAYGGSGKAGKAPAGIVQADGTVYVPPRVVPGAGAKPGTYEDYTDIVKLLCAWGGFFWEANATQVLSDGTTVTHGFGTKYGLPNVDPVLGVNAGRVWGDFENTGTAGIAALPVPQWDKKSLMDGINYIREIIGFVFYIDEDGAVVWRLPNIYATGNYVGNAAHGASRTPNIITIDEKQTLTGLTAKLSSRNVRERYFVASLDGTTGALSQGYNPNPVGLRRVGGWTDQHFETTAECQLMADFIALRALLTYRTDTVTIVGNPAIQIDDQVRIFEQVTGEAYLHYVKGVSCNFDMETRVYTYSLDTQWLGEHPGALWIFNPATLSRETQTYLQAITVIPPVGA